MQGDRIEKINGTWAFQKLASHVGHQIECVYYGDMENVSIECLYCDEVLVTEDRNG